MDQRSNGFRDQMNRLPQATPWNALSPESATELTHAATVINHERREWVTSTIGIVVTGVIGVAQDVSDGRRVFSSLFHAGDLFDMRRDNRQPQGALMALTPTRLLTLNEAKLEGCKSCHPDIADAIITQLREHFSRMRDHCTDLACKTPIERLASALLEFRRWPETSADDPDGHAIRMPIRRSDIADYIGVQPETVSRTIRQLEGECVITLRQEDLVAILDVPMLRTIANGGRPRRSTRRN